MKPEHTPEPQVIRVIMGDDQSQRVAVIQHNGSVEDEANARLIAAAPDLLEALEIALEYLDPQLGSLFGVRVTIEEAIAKAKGETIPA